MNILSTENLEYKNQDQIIIVFIWDKKVVNQKVQLTCFYQHEVANEGETGKVTTANFRDRLGRTVLIFRPAMQVLSTTSSLSL
jgi:hypothetical protein